MTLIAGIKCRDGYIVASDTAITVGASVVQGRKIDHYASTQGDPYRIIVAWSGSMAYAKMTSQRIRDGVEELADRSFSNVKKTVEEIVRETYLSYVGPLYLNNAPDAVIPNYSLIMAIEGRDGYGIFSTEGPALYEVEPSAFNGSGQELAGFLAERLLIHRKTMSVQYSTAAAVYIIKHIFNAAKKSASGVGGNTEIIARLMSEDTSDPFHDELFSLSVDPALDSMYLWGIDEKLANSFRLALNRHSHEGTIKAVMAEIEDTMQQIRSAAQREREHKTGRLMHLVELEDGKWSANFSEHPDSRS